MSGLTRRTCLGALVSSLGLLPRLSAQPLHPYAGAVISWLHTSGFVSPQAVASPQRTVQGMLVQFEQGSRFSPPSAAT